MSKYEEWNLIDLGCNVGLQENTVKLISQL